MQQKKPTKEEIITALERIGSKTPDRKVTMDAFIEETGWTRYWFDRYWPTTGGYRGACEEAGVRPGPIIGVDTNVRQEDEEVAARFADAVEAAHGIPTLKKLCAIAKIAPATVCREKETYERAKARLIRTYLAFPPEQRKGESVDTILQHELDRLEGNGQAADVSQVRPLPITNRHQIAVSEEYITLVRQFHDRGEEEKRQLVGQFFYEILGYKRSRVRSEHKHNDVRVHDRRNEPWLVVEVKPSLSNEREKRAARRQAFDYAHRAGMRFVVISDADFYEVYDRRAGERLRYDEMRQGSFCITSLRLRDADLLSLLASER